MGKKKARNASSLKPNACHPRESGDPCKATRCDEAECLSSPRAGIRAGSFIEKGKKNSGKITPRAVVSSGVNAVSSQAGSAPGSGIFYRSFNRTAFATQLS